MWNNQIVKARTGLHELGESEMKRLAVALAAAFAALGMVLASTPANAVTFLYIELTSTSGTFSGWCLNDPHGSTANGTAQELWTCSGEDYGGYGVEESSFGDSNYYQIVVQSSGKCLSDQGGGDGVDVVQETCNGSPDEALCWNSYLGNNNWPIAWIFANDYALGDSNDKGANGNPIVVWSLNWSNSEAWAGPQINLRYACTNGDVVKS
jgi:hypothetical protein